MKKYIHIIFLLFPIFVSAQQITGNVANPNGELLIGATVYWLETNTGVLTEPDGTFSISSTGINDNTLIASYVGYKADTFSLGEYNYVEFILNELHSTEEIVVTSQRQGITISNTIPFKTEQITQVELGKAACCDLAGCFSTQTTVQSQTTNVITHSKELKILGLSGVYNQVMIDGFPIIQGLTYTYGISSIPGSLVESIFISKGANSVLQGYESISGQINIITKDPVKSDKFFLNGYINSFGEKHFNADYTFKKGKWSNITAVHSVLPANKRDLDEDGFLDLPLLTRYMAINKLKYGNDRENGWATNIVLRYLDEKRTGGQVAYNPDTDYATTNAYGQLVDIQQPEFWSKTSYRFNSKNKIDIFLSTSYHRQKASFGTTLMDNDQLNYYANLQYNFDYADQYDVKFGLSYRGLNLNETISFASLPVVKTYDGTYKTEDRIAGIFVENNMKFFNEKLTWIVGLRADNHNRFGTQITPRTLVKYNVTDEMTFGANIGKGWRTANVFSENIGLLASSRDIVIADDLKPEEAINLGANITQKFYKDQINGHISLDFYQTTFQNQIFPDYDANAGIALIENFTEKSVSNGFQAEIYASINDRVELKFGYNYLDVYRKIGDLKEELPFNSKHKLLTTVSYKPKSKKFHIDLNMHWHGKKKLPNTSNSPVEFQRPDQSKSYFIANAQFTYIFKQFEIYTGCENIFDFKQEKPILSWENPFGPYFDTSSVWGPTKGREFYIGFRYKILG